MNKNKISALLLAVLVVLIIGGTLRSFAMYTLGNELIFLFNTGIAIVALFGVNNVAAFVVLLIPVLIWHICSLYVLGTFLGLLEMVLFWYLIAKRLKKEKSSPQTPNLETDGREVTLSFHPLTIWGFPLFWETLIISEVGGGEHPIQRIFLESVFAQRNYGQDVSSLCDPELVGGFWCKLIGLAGVKISYHDASKKEHQWPTDDRIIYLKVKDARLLAGSRSGQGLLSSMISGARMRQYLTEGPFRH